MRFPPDDRLYISVITYMEVLGYQFKDDDEKKQVENLCRYFPVLDLNKNIIEAVISLRRQNKSKLPDAIIFATAMIHKLDLVTANVSDFENFIPQIKIINPMS
ncbi:MAG: type II toxin-antitoxin system VapC family toxin [Prolixibacteraceae bacterium]